MSLSYLWNWLVLSRIKLFFPCHTEALAKVSINLKREFAYLKRRFFALNLKYVLNLWIFRSFHSLKMTSFCHFDKFLSYQAQAKYPRKTHNGLLRTKALRQFKAFQNLEFSCKFAVRYLCALLFRSKVSVRFALRWVAFYPQKIYPSHSPHPLFDKGVKKGLKALWLEIINVA